MSHLTKIGQSHNDSSVDRIAYSKKDLKARKLVIQTLNKIGLKVIVDSIGNIFAVPYDYSPNQPIVMAGSHIDSVEKGGKYDGTVGVVCAMEVLEVIKENKLMTDIPVGILIFACEEASRFGVAKIGSSVFTGKMSIFATTTFSRSLPMTSSTETRKPPWWPPHPQQ